MGKQHGRRLQTSEQTTRGGGPTMPHTGGELGRTGRPTQGPENAWWGVSSGPWEAVYIFLLGRRGGEPPARKRHSTPAPRAPGPWDWSLCSYCQNARQKRKWNCGGNSALLSKDQVFASTCTLESLLTGWQPAAHAFWLFRSFSDKVLEYIHGTFLIQVSSGAKLHSWW